MLTEYRINGSPRAVRIGTYPPSVALAAGQQDEALAAWASGFPTRPFDTREVIDWAVGVGTSAPFPGEGSTSLLWSLLASAAAWDVGIARILEPHLDALAIFRQAPPATDLASVGAGPLSSWGVFAAEGPASTLRATETGPGAWVLTGDKPWCSLAGQLSHALVTAVINDEGARQLFVVNLRTEDVSAHEGPWASRGLQQVVSAPVTFKNSVAVPVGDPGWYLDRAGFWWGGLGVAACWYGGAVGVARRVAAAAMNPNTEPDQLMLTAIGRLDVLLGGSRALLAEAAHSVDAAGATARSHVADDHAEPPSAGASHTQRSGVLSAARVRADAAATAERVIGEAGHALGPAPLALDEDHARRVADLMVYIRQHHADRDLASLGRKLLASDDSEVAPW
ncbi:acyl-CoA/acyl-ACP dehydrogenase [Lysinibacter cavernae]|uniref:Alkylation response protein AidB-like acyl-CoA dehydrogenase n=1 Tax=Lysinibacter cavernae TaxID=1640652 RepID=A0A7X5TU79_9MICO|nr:acyl-CoA/acyl-ACP dehydrogenase [Lysinibacter cavernae]NIH53332.1 alkylation response protein AidB-like acyl-CoA dehydrogenase [Lysinibacter cavernae]